MQTCTHSWGLLLVMALLLQRPAGVAGEPPTLRDVAGRHPDVLTLPADIENPRIHDGELVAGRMVLQTLPAYAGTEVAHAVYLPRDWTPEREFPVLVEYLGNSCRVRDPRGIGHSISEGIGCIWVVLPFVSPDGRSDVDWWWGDVDATVAYAKAAVPAICREWSGDPERVLIMGYSRGAIAVNAIGLHDDEIAKLWCGSMAVSHYDDGHIPWGMTPAEQADAAKRLARLGRRPQCIAGEYCSRPQLPSHLPLLKTLDERGITTFGEAVGTLGLEPCTVVEKTLAFVRANHPAGDFTVVDLGWVTHGSAVLQRDTAERRQLRAWLARVLEPRPRGKPP
jgi:hypothetical protein